MTKVTSFDIVPLGMRELIPSCCNFLCAVQAGKDVELAARWRHCALSGEELRTPIVACELGR